MKSSSVSMHKWFVLFSECDDNVLSCTVLDLSLNWPFSLQTGPIDNILKT